MDPLKPGTQTTEFWLTVAAMILGGLLASGLFCTAHDSVAQAIACKVVGGAVSLLSLLGYTGARTVLKAASSSIDASYDHEPYDPTKSGQ